ncbi:MAG TPA: hypothetical protein VEB68_00235 [Croceibacterium sp.]|nr:hypothetical protein [Croceibacterium sp.]
MNQDVSRTGWNTPTLVRLGRIADVRGSNSTVNNPTSAQCSQNNGGGTCSS